MSRKKSVPRLRFEKYKYNGKWISKKVSDLSNVTYGGGTPKTSVIEYWKGNIPWISSSDLKDHIVYNVLPSRYITKEAIVNSATKLVPKNSIAVVTRVGVGKLTLIPFEYTTSQDFLSISNIKENELYSVYTLYKLLQTEKNETQGTSIKGITKNELLDKKIYITTNIKEQEKIGYFFEKIDKMIQLQQSKVNKVKDIKSAYLSEMFPKEGEPYPKKRFEGFTEPWEAYNLGEVAQIKTGNTNVQDAVQDGKYTFFDRSIDIKRIDKYYYDEETIIYPGEGSEFYPRYFSGKYALHQRAYAITSDIINLEYLANMMMLRNNHFVNNAVGSTVKSLRMENFTNCKIFVPSLEEQKKIARLFKNINNQIFIEAEKLTKLEKLKQAYLNDMFV